MNKLRRDIISGYRRSVLSANKELTKKELFKDMLNRLYAGNKDIETVINKISVGAERAVVNIPRKDRVHRGSADTLYNNIIIEFENDLRISLSHAKEQLSGYLLGQFRSGEGYNFTLIASDFINWRVFAPDISQIELLGSLNEDELILNEVLSASFTLTEANGDEFFYWLDRFLFKAEKQKATLIRIEETFGYQSNVFIDSLREMSLHFVEAKKYGEVQTAYEQWKRFLSIAYGSFDGSESNFLVHTYLSIFSKMLAYSVLSNDDYIDEEELRDIMSGSIFERYNISNFVESDFFYWIKSDRSFRSLKKVFRLIAQEITLFDFTDIDEDILKGIYQELIDLDTRHSLGEYYTPDWLCELIVNEYDFKPTDKILDPSCGSGSFLRAAIKRLKTLHPQMTAEDINNNIFGIDIHPLSVQIAKTNILISIGKDFIKSRKPLSINIILANTLLAPEGVNDLFGSSFQLSIDREKVSLSTQILDDNKLFDVAIDICDELANQTLNDTNETSQTLNSTIKSVYADNGFNGNISESFYNIYLSLKKAKERGRDSIWSFILKNIYKPYFLREKFDYVIGNPPWFTYSSVKNEEYQDVLNKLADLYAVKPERIANFPHLEIAAIFLSYCSSYFLKSGGHLSFVLPRSFMNADHHDNTRSGRAKGFSVKEIWDMQSVSPLFRVPSMVLFADKSDNAKQNLIKKGISGKSFIGKLPAHNCNLEKALPNLELDANTWFYVSQGSSSAFSTTKSKGSDMLNPYKSSFKQGATIVPRNFYFVELNQEMPPDWDDRIINIKTADFVQSDAKAPWKGHLLKGQIESRFLFRTALSKSILPFGLLNPELIVLPITIDVDRKIQLHSFESLRKNTFLRTSGWFRNVHNIWEQLKTEKNKNISNFNYLNWQNKLSSQNLNAPYLVLYNASGKDANATIVKREDLDLEFIVESKTYVYYTENIKEAYYLTAILNSSVPNLMIKDFQTRGLFGPRDIHKKILNVYFPKFDNKNKVHLHLADISEKAHSIVSSYIKENPQSSDLRPTQLGRLRIDVKKQIAKEMKEMDNIVKKIVGK